MRWWMWLLGYVGVGQFLVAPIVAKQIYNFASGPHRRSLCYECYKYKSMPRWFDVGENAARMWAAGWLAAAIGLVWPLSFLAMGIMWPTLRQDHREKGLRAREETIKRLEKELGIGEGK